MLNSIDHTAMAAVETALITSKNAALEKYREVCPPDCSLYRPGRYGCAIHDDTARIKEIEGEILVDPYGPRLSINQVNEISNYIGATVRNTIAAEKNAGDGHQGTQSRRRIRSVITRQGYFYNPFTYQTASGF